MQKLNFLLFMCVLLLVGGNKAHGATFPVKTTQCNSPDWNIRYGVYEQTINHMMLVDALYFDYWAERKSDNAEIVSAMGDVAANAIALIDVSSAFFIPVSKTELITMSAGEVSNMLFKASEVVTGEVTTAGIVMQQLTATALNLVPPKSPISLATDGVTVITKIVGANQYYQSLGFSVIRAEVHAAREALNYHFWHCGDFSAVKQQLNISLSEYESCRTQYPQTSVTACAAYIIAQKPSTKFYHPSPDIFRINDYIRTKLQTLNGIYLKRYSLLSDEQRAATDVVMSPFVDVPEHAWFYEYIEPLRKLGIVSGGLDGLFRPNDYVSYAELTKMLVKSYQLRKQIVIKNWLPQNYEDYVDQWYYPYMKLAYNIENHSNRQETVLFWGNAAPEYTNKATRIDAARMLLNALELPFYWGDEQKFIDVSGTPESGHPWIMTIDRLEGVGTERQTATIFPYSSDNRFYPNNFLTRAEAAAIIYRAFRLYYVQRGL